MKVLNVYNPDNLPLEKIFVYGKTAVVLPKNAEILYSDHEPVYPCTAQPRQHIKVKDFEYKLCTKCYKWLRLFEFYKDKKQSDGLQPFCVDCLKIYRDSMRRKKRFYESRQAGKPK